MTGTRRSIQVAVLLVGLTSWALAGPGLTDLLLGEKTPRPTSFNEAALQLGEFGALQKRLGERGFTSSSDVWLGSLRFGPSTLQVVIKPTTGLTKDRVLSDVPAKEDNLRAAAAYHLNRFAQLIETPEHVIRLDVPVDTKGGTGEAGVQVYVQNVVRIKDKKDPNWRKLRDGTKIMAAELEAVAVFDCLVGNTDRHFQNWLFRTTPAAGQRHVVAIDHSRTFPTGDYLNRRKPNPDAKRPGWRGTYIMIEAHIASSSKGRISGPLVAKLNRLQRTKRDVDAVLKLYLDDASAAKMWDRVEEMLKTRKVFLP